MRQDGWHEAEMAAVWLVLARLCALRGDAAGFVLFLLLATCHLGSFANQIWRDWRVRQAVRNLRRQGITMRGI